MPQTDPGVTAVRTPAPPASPPRRRSSGSDTSRRRRVRSSRTRVIDRPPRRTERDLADSRPMGDGGRRDQQPGRRRGAAIPADRAAVVGVRQLRDALQGLRPEGRAARPVREGRRRRPGPPVHRRRADASRSTSRGTGSTTTPTSPATPPTLGVAPRDDQLERLPGRRLHARQRLQPGSAGPPQGARPPPRLHRHHGRDRLARPQAVVLGRDELPRPGRHPRPPGPPRRGARRGLRPARRRTSGCCSSTSSSSRRSTRWTCPTGGRRTSTASRPGPRRRSSSTPATTRRARTSSSSSRRCCAPDRLGGFDFNSRFYADDDLMVGSADPFQLFRIMHEVVQAGGARARGRASRSCSTSATTSSRRSPARSGR